MEAGRGQSAGLVWSICEREREGERRTNYTIIPSIATWDRIVQKIEQNGFYLALNLSQNSISNLLASRALQI